MEKLKLGVLGSGKGSNFRAIADAIDRGELAAEVRVVISDVENAGILELARSRGIRAEYVAPGRFRTKMEPEAEQRVASVNITREVLGRFKSAPPASASQAATRLADVILNQRKSGE